MVWTIIDFTFVLQLNYYFEQNYYYITEARIFFFYFYIWTFIPLFESGYSTPIIKHKELNVFSTSLRF